MDSPVSKKVIDQAAASARLARAARGGRNEAGKASAFRTLAGICRARLRHYFELPVRARVGDRNVDDEAAAELWPTLVADGERGLVGLAGHVESDPVG
jgi:hypothetical protein